MPATIYTPCDRLTIARADADELTQLEPLWNNMQ
jgi:hypothetical protein